MTPTAADEATPAAASAAPSTFGPSSAGAALRRAREARGLHIAALAATLKVPQSKLEALEADRYHELPDATFARALARSMCRVLKIEAAPVLAMLPSSGAEASLDRVTPGLNQPFRERSVSQEPMLSAELLKRPAVLGVGVLLVAAVAVYAIPSSWIEQVTARFRSAPESSTTTATPGPGSAIGTAPVATDSPPTNIEAPVVSASEAAPQSTASVSTLPPQTSGAATTITAPSPAPATTQAAVTTPPAASTAASVAAGAGQPIQAGAPAPGTSPLKVRASAESWVEVVDAKGQVLLSRLLRPGDLVDVHGVAPLRLRVGNVSGTELVFRGQPVDLAARARDNVARLELN
ncbi:cytoskeleton protein RodZ [Mitsuaria sp. BK045]|uniref:RodZ domain-containing protein n=1 Tax=unclassified Roseateles TaxID=2626991 RepID=UPI00160862A7|nr:MULTISPECIES: RodZ domain-containing protein [unclassified Roseateles]MBB3292355.1 cytoskeleton protein RodZ [Mitsuaria sp. BK041]MBB3361573.1 cytoskeleton protein RodZ [Mitsuaria sp. BK045]